MKKSILNSLMIFLLIFLVIPKEGMSQASKNEVYFTFKDIKEINSTITDIKKKIFSDKKNNVEAYQDIKSIFSQQDSQTKAANGPIRKAINVTLLTEMISKRVSEFKLKLLNDALHKMAEKKGDPDIIDYANYDLFKTITNELFDFHTSESSGQNLLKSFLRFSFVSVISMMEEDQNVKFWQEILKENYINNIALKRNVTYWYLQKQLYMNNKKLGKFFKWMDFDTFIDDEVMIKNKIDEYINKEKTLSKFNSLFNEINEIINNVDIHMLISEYKSKAGNINDKILKGLFEKLENRFYNEDKYPYFKIMDLLAKISISNDDPEAVLSYSKEIIKSCSRIVYSYYIKKKDEKAIKAYKKINFTINAITDNIVYKKEENKYLFNTEKAIEPFIKKAEIFNANNTFFFHFAIGMGYMRSWRSDDDIEKFEREGRTYSLVSEQIGFGWQFGPWLDGRFKLKCGLYGSGILYKLVEDNEESDSIIFGPFIAFEFYKLFQFYVAPISLNYLPNSKEWDRGISVGVTIPLGDYLSEL